MAQQKSKSDSKRPAKETVTIADTLHDTVTVMKPFVQLSLKTLQAIAAALVFIVKNIPKPEDHRHAAPNGDKIIKI